MLVLIDIIMLYDLADETGRQNLKSLIFYLLSHAKLEAKYIEKLIRCAENVILEVDIRMDFFYNIVNEHIENMNEPINFSHQTILSIIDGIVDQETKVQLLKTKMHILELKDEEMAAIVESKYDEAEKSLNQLIDTNKLFLDLLHDCLLARNDKEREDVQSQLEFIQTLRNRRGIDPAVVCKCLQICFFGNCSKQVPSLVPCMSDLYKVSRNWIYAKK